MESVTHLQLRWRNHTKKLISIDFFFRKVANNLQTDSQDARLHKRVGDNYQNDSKMISKAHASKSGAECCVQKFTLNTEQSKAS